MKDLKVDRERAIRVVAVGGLILVGLSLLPGLLRTPEPPELPPDVGFRPTDRSPATLGVGSEKAVVKASAKSGAKRDRIRRRSRGDRPRKEKSMPERTEKNGKPAERRDRNADPPPPSPTASPPTPATAPAPSAPITPSPPVTSAPATPDPEPEPGSGAGTGSSGGGSPSATGPGPSAAGPDPGRPATGDGSEEFAPHVRTP